MPKIIRPKTDKEIRTLSFNVDKRTKAYHFVGGAPGLILMCQPPSHDGDIPPRSWIQRISIEGRQRELGLGSYPVVSLREARQRANDNKAKVLAGKNPLGEKHKRRQKQREERRLSITFEQLMNEYFVERLAISGARNPESKIAKEKNQIIKYAIPFIGQEVIQNISPTMIASLLRPIWLTMPETAMRVRLHTYAILRLAKARQLYSGENPADLETLKDLLPKPVSRRSELKHRKQSGNQPALQLGDCTRFWALIQSQELLSDRAIEFQILTATRPFEARSARWEDIDIKQKIWTIPAESMKMGIAHRVPLSTTSLDILSSLPKNSKYVFASKSADGFISDTAMRKRISNVNTLDIDNGGGGFYDTNELDANSSPRIATLHGMRSTFAVWAREVNKYSKEIVDKCLAHKEVNRVTAAYQRTDLIEQRTIIMEEWAKYLTND